MSIPSTSEPFVFDPSTTGSAIGGADRPESRRVGAGSHTGGDWLVRQTQREINQLLRELAAAARDLITPDKFASILCDRTLRAMSAQGVVLWQADPVHRSESGKDHHYRAVARVGRVTDRTLIQPQAEQSVPTDFPGSILPATNKPQSDSDGDPPNPAQSPAWHAHQALLRTVYADAVPVVVPPTPGVTDSDVAANPTPVPAALVVLDGGVKSLDLLPRRIIEVFLEPDGGVAAQRGYLRFVCQVADLAGEYFRSQQLRSLLDQQTLAEQCDQAIAAFQQVTGRDQVAALVVDRLADIFQIHRLALCRRLAPTKTQILAVSHVETIDQHSDSAHQIRQATQAANDGVATFWLAGKTASAQSTSTDRTSSGGDPTLPKQSTAPEPTDPDDDPVLTPWFVLSGSGSQDDLPDGGYRLTAFQRRDSPPNAIEGFRKRELIRIGRQAIAWLENLERNDRSPWRRLFLFGRRVPYRSREKSSVWITARRRLAGTAIIALATFVIVMVMMIPVSKTIRAEATLRAKDTLRVCAVRDAVVDQIHVRHGQTVLAGDKLLTLSDGVLEQQLIQLVGRHAVLTEQKIRLDQQIVDASSGDFETYESVQSQFGITDQEIIAVNQQLDLLRRLERSLTIRSDRPGTVDAWQIEKRLSGRPVSRGDVLMQVIAKDSPWVVDANIPPTRIGRLQTAAADDLLSAIVTLDDVSGTILTATNCQFGPTTPGGPGVRSANPGHTQTTLSLRQQNVGARIAGDAGSRNGSTAKVLFHCGKIPLVDLLVGDLYRDARRVVSMHYKATSAERTTTNRAKQP